MEEDKADPRQGSTPEHSTLELSLRGAIPDVIRVSQVGTIPTSVNSCGDSSGYSIGMSVSSYLSKLVFSKILLSFRSSAMINMLRFVLLTQMHNSLVTL